MSDEPICKEHKRRMQLCECGCGMFRCCECVHSDESPTGRKERDIRKMWDFGKMYGRKRDLTIATSGRRHGRTTFCNYSVQAHKARSLAMNMNYAEIEKLVMASYLKCKSDCPLLKLLFPPKLDSQPKE